MKISDDNPSLNLRPHTHLEPEVMSLGGVRDVRRIVISGLSRKEKIKKSNEYAKQEDKYGLPLFKVEFNNEFIERATVLIVKRIKWVEVRDQNGGIKI